MAAKIKKGEGRGNVGFGSSYRKGADRDLGKRIGDRHGIRGDRVWMV